MGFVLPRFCSAIQSKINIANVSQCNISYSFLNYCILLTSWKETPGEDNDLFLSKSINKSKFSTVVSTYPTIPLIEPLSGPTICAPEIKTEKSKVMSAARPILLSHARTPISSHCDPRDSRNKDS